MGCGRAAMFPEDRVLVGVINRKRDLDVLLTECWYRIPQARMPQGVYAEYLAFFLSRAAARGRGASGIYYFARFAGVELLHRRDLLPDEAGHPRADERYYKVQLTQLEEKAPPILNSTRRSISFIFTTWDRFVGAVDVCDLYSSADYYVDRIFYALQDTRTLSNS